MSATLIHSKRANALNHGGYGDVKIQKSMRHFAQCINHLDISHNLRPAS